jgi:hypothetical protein
VGPLGSRLGGIPVRQAAESPVIGALSSGHSGHPSPKVPSNLPAPTVRAVGRGHCRRTGCLAPQFSSWAARVNPNSHVGLTGSGSGPLVGAKPLRAGVPTAEPFGSPRIPFPRPPRLPVHRSEPAPEWDGSIGVRSPLLPSPSPPGCVGFPAPVGPLSMVPGLRPSGWLLGTFGNIDTQQTCVNTA